MYIHVQCIYIIVEHLPRAHQYGATLGGARTVHVCVHNVHEFTRTQALYWYINEHVLQCQVIHYNGQL